MARKHHTRHSRGKSRYPDRLRSRGRSSATVRMEDLETLRRRQARRDDLSSGVRVAAWDAAAIEDGA